MSRDGWLQGAGIVVAMALTGGSMIAYSTWTLSQQISAARADMSAEIAVVATKQAADEARILAMENTERDHRADDLASRAALSQQLTSVIQGLADVRVDVGKLARGK